LKLAGAVTGVGVLQIDAGATLELGSSTASGEVIGFASSTGTVQLDAPGSTAATFKGFTGSDIINLGGAVATGLNYNTTSKILTVSGASGTIASLKFTGSYTQANFTLNPTNTEILFAATPLSASSIGAGAASFLPPSEAGSSLGASAAAWTLDGAGSAADLGIPAASAAAWPDAGGAGSDPSAAYGMAFPWFGESVQAAMLGATHQTGGV
jgi:hypothetical protein